ncbi:3-phosphoserine/phosphohydroxythreonine transaminase [Cupriavidus sp. 2KB_3]|uniref:3-phosphoserine/phosphohydroxythreonine transaminase n=1 Tax=Cupriavidus sp. 2KB_3 TaxID=3232980 RepID=UPI003F924E52
MESPLRCYNFSAGPSALPESVLGTMREDLLNWQDTGTSVMELSHRSEAFVEMAARAEQDLRELLGIPAHYKVLFLQGGGTLQFSQIPMNLMHQAGPCDYIDTGYWSRKAQTAAARYGEVNIAASAEGSGYKAIPPQSAWRPSDAPAYLHYTANETIDGLEFHWIPDVGDDCPLVADFSANILSGPLDVARFGLIYAGAQKNIGPSGLTLVIVRDDLLGRAHAYCPDVMNYQVLAEHQSMYNTPATFAWYAAGLVFQWLKSLGGLEAVRARNARKQDMLYSVIDRSGCFINNVVAADRSHMNVPFHLADPRLEGIFLAGAAERGLLGLKGHRAKGGMRASLYNAVTEQAVQALTGYMAEFEQHHG